jgi:(p)ppGpp synthase/HD superfamily hydrolase
MFDIVERAKAFAEHAHRDQKRKYTGQPYFDHLHEVAMLCKQYGAADKTIAAAYLHDAIEDQDVTYHDIAAEFGVWIAEAVLSLTDIPAVKGGLNRAARKALDRERLAAGNSDVQTIKCADLISNTSSIVEYDKGFARYYLREKRATLDVLLRANGPLRSLAWKTLIDAESRLGMSR